MNVADNTIYRWENIGNIGEENYFKLIAIMEKPEYNKPEPMVDLDGVQTNVDKL